MARRINPSQFKGIYSIVNIGPVLIGYFTDSNVLGNAYDEKGNNLGPLIEKMPLLKQGWVTHNTVLSLMRIAMYHGDMQKDSKDLQMITPDEKMVKWFGTVPPMEIKTGAEESSALLLPELGKLVGGYLVSQPSLKAYTKEFIESGKPMKGVSVGEVNTQGKSTFEVMSSHPPRRSKRHGGMIAFDPLNIHTYDFQPMTSLNFYPKELVDEFLLTMKPEELQQLKDQLLRESEIVKSTELFEKQESRKRREMRGKLTNLITFAGDKNHK